MNPALPTCLALAIAAMIACAAVLGLLLGTGWAWRLAVDVPNARSLHERPTPRVGGWGLIPVSLLMAAWFAPGLSVILGGAALLALVSVLDDRWDLPARWRFLAHLAVAALTVGWLAPPVSAWLWIVFVVGLVWCANLYNFMDGANGLAGATALLGFGAYALAAAPHAPALAAAAAIIAGAAAGFLCFNVHPARLFLGDCGSIPLGFLAGALGVAGWQQGDWPAWFAPMVFSPFIADATVTLLRRLCRGERVWQAHREHYYQRLIRMGAGHLRTVGAWTALSAIGCALALALLHASVPMQASGVAAWTLMLVIAGRYVDHRWARFEDKSL